MARAIDTINRRKLSNLKKNYKMCVNKNGGSVK